ncbi:MAG: MBL fold metallo-hydrolase [bacterium]|nr:MBL fold metallo-hydrolase [bacterium]
MKITKFPQSNLIIEENGKYLMIDPGVYTFEKFSAADLGKVDAVLITHEHPDHFDAEHLKAFTSLPIYANSAVVKLAAKSGIKVNPVQDRVEFEVENFKILPIDLAHFQGLWCRGCNNRVTTETITEDGKCGLHMDLEPERRDGPPNTGYVINGIFFDPGDGIKIADLKIESAAIPIAGPTVRFPQAWELTKSLGAKRIVPIHYSAWKADPNEFANQAPEKVEVIVLDDGQSVEI